MQFSRGRLLVRSMENKKRINLKTCCRLCLTENSSVSVLDYPSIQQTLSTSFSIKVQHTDKVSRGVCSGCFNFLREFNKFSQTCSDTQEKFKQVYRLQNSGNDSNMDVQIEKANHEEMTFKITDVRTESRDIKTVKDTELEMSNSTKASDNSNDEKAEADGGERDDTDESDEVEFIDEEEKELLSAAGLKSLNHSSTPLIAREPLSKIEISYIEKCNAMYMMYNSQICACHNVSYATIKNLLAHLRKLPFWFPIYTCYRCMITFSDRSSATKHQVNCSKTDLDNLLKLSNIKNRSEIKTRIYQNYKCKKCKFVFSLHEDFMTHVDENHSKIRLPKKCYCGRIFTTLEDYKDHAYVSCLVEYYCDICSVTARSLEAFKKHGAEVHDNSEGFVLLQNDGFRPKRKSIAEALPVDEALPPKRPRKSVIPICDQKEVIDPIIMQKIPGTKCPICSQEFSSNSNMHRHYSRKHAGKTSKDTNDDALITHHVDTSSIAEKKKRKKTQKKCEECEEEFQSQAELDRHRSVHLNIKISRDSKTRAFKSTTLNKSNNADNILFMCETCDTLFVSKEELKKHKLIHEQMPVLEPAVDVTTLESNPVHNNKEHLETSHNRKSDLPIAPNPQPDTAPSNDNFDIKAIEAESFFTCKTCYKACPTYDALKDHIKCHATTKVSPKDKVAKKIWCNICHRAFDTPEKLESHKSENHSKGNTNLISKQEATPSVFSCDICTMTFTSKVALTKHLEQHEKENKNKNKKTKENKEHLEKPKKPKAEGKIKPQLSCNICQKTFDTNAALQSHLGWHKRDKIADKFVKSSKPGPKPKSAKEKVEQSKAFKCNTCGSNLPNDTALQVHMLEKHGNPVAPPRCAICNLDFSTQEEYDVHQQFHKAVERSKAKKSYPCSHCDLTFKSPDALRVHTAQNHKYYCNQCDRVFDKQTQLSTHLKVHAKQKAVTGNAPKPEFSCAICKKGFQLAKDMRKHVMEAHPFRK